MPNEYTPQEEYEWLLQGLSPESALMVLDHEIQRQTEVVAKQTKKLHEAQAAYEKLTNNEFPRDPDGLITLSKNNPLAL
jgi:hypothetical protein